MKKISSVLITLLLLLSMAAAKTKDNNDKETKAWPQNRIGLSASTFTGYGLTYYRHFGDKIVGKVCLFAFGGTQADVDNSKDLQSILGTEIQYNLHKTKYTRLHIFGAFSFWYNENQYEYRNEKNTYTQLSIDRTYVTGVGFGFEFLAWGIISFNIETGLIGWFGINSDSDNSSVYPYSKTTYPKSYGFGIGGGITYAF
jgi:hypothetical protein